MRTPPPPSDPTTLFPIAWQLPSLTVDVDELTAAAAHAEAAAEAASLALHRLVPLPELLAGCGEAEVSRAGGDALTAIAALLAGLGQALGGHALGLIDAARNYRETEARISHAADQSGLGVLSWNRQGSFVGEQYALWQAPATSSQFGPWIPADRWSFAPPGAP